MTCNELPSKSLELEQRIGRLEVALSRIDEALEAYAKEVAATRAQLDYLVAKALS